ncbi:pilus (MSHA type) biogenesis protein MshL [Burkholderia sp. 9775_39]|uniref:pilus (MSHA type) biogenesis protein MshL n=1 Tax=unclassified Burkholderia TaxID=2613784 RepID=UPI0018C4431E|nr:MULTISPECIES: pilus (MSHA type) biogenesis protein MshL [unclassified Burkholderia]MBG0881251.1 pilus (MSHA type) biogenesis protein MshL [Burkholderia sp. 9775_39]MBG0887672.1 pilus (MSHA type) biogenesis protein MshL [Burkholderia sp. 9773_38]
MNFRLTVVWLLCALGGCTSWPNSASHMSGTDGEQMQKIDETATEGSHDVFARLDSVQQHVESHTAGPAQTAGVSGLNASVLDRMVDINMTNAPVADLLTALADQLHMNVMIDPTVLKLGQRATLIMRHASARDVLNQIFGLFDIDGHVKDKLIVATLMARQTFSLEMLGGKAQLNIDDGGDVFGGAGKDAGSSALKGNTLISGEVGSKSDRYEDLLKAVQTIVSGSSGAVKSADDGYVTLDRSTGILFVSARPSRLKAVEAFIERIRTVRGRQVQIEAQLIDVQLSDGFNWGVDWNLLTKNLVGQLGTGAATLNPVTTSLSAGLGTRTVTIPAETVGATAGYGNGLAYSGNAFSAAINALRTFGTVRMLSNPVVRLSNGMPAYLSVGTNYRYISKISSSTSNTGGGASTTSVNVDTDSLFSGVVVGVSAAVNDSGRIELFVHPMQTQVQATSLQQVQIGTTGNAVTLPIVDVKGLTTTLKLNGGDTVIIGGLIDQQTTNTNNGLPGVADIPVLGNLFDAISKQHRNRELIIVLRARVL